MLETLDPPTVPTGHAAHLRTDLTPLEAIELSLTTDDTKRCEAWVGSGPIPEDPTPCPEAAVWFGALSCNAAHGVAACVEHRARIDDLIARGALVDCSICGSADGRLTWRAL